MVEQRVLVIILIAAGLGAVWLGLRFRSWRHRQRSARDLLARLGIGGPLVLAFSTPGCVPCRVQQKPALAELLRRHPSQLEVRDIDATEQPDLADRFGIMTVPSTVVIDPRGRVLAINHGMTRWEKLAAQLSLNGLAATPRVPGGPHPESSTVLRN